MSWTTLLADGVTDPISGGAGWVGAGLLGMVLTWLLLKHLPEKDKQIRELISEKDKQLEKKDEQISRMLDRKNEQLREMLASHDVTLKRMNEENKNALERVIQHCKEEMIHTSAVWTKEITHITEHIDELIKMFRGEIRITRGSRRSHKQDSDHEAPQS